MTAVHDMWCRSRSELFIERNVSERSRHPAPQYRCFFFQLSPLFSLSLASSYYLPGCCTCFFYCYFFFVLIWVSCRYKQVSEQSSNPVAHGVTRGTGSISLQAGGIPRVENPNLSRQFDQNVSKHVLELFVYR